MRFRSEIHIPASDWNISHATPLLLAGSCFSDEVGKKLIQDLFPVKINPTGTVYHPAALLNPLCDMMMHGTSSALQSILPRTVEQGGVYRNMSVAGILSAEGKAHAEQVLASRLNEAHQNLQQSSFIVLTFGTAFAYRWKRDGDVVANCHKLPAAEFDKELYSADRLLNETEAFFETLHRQQPQTRVLVTVSPVRHMREGLEGDRLSKSILRVYAHELTQCFNFVRYFPSYEILTDDLRDYRFYADDLAHPSAQAVEYIYEKFGEVFFPESTLALLARLRALRSELAHRPLAPGSEAHRQFRQKLLEKLRALQDELPVEGWIQSFETGDQK